MICLFQTNIFNFTKTIPLTSDANFLLNELDGSKKNYGWSNEVCSSIRMNWQGLKNVIQARENRAIMYSMQPLTKVRDSFDDEDFKKSVDFLPVPVLDPILNSIVEDLTRRPPRAEVKAEDPTAINEKKEDLEILQNRRLIEGDRTELQSRVGLPPYKIPYDKFNGNVEEFDQMGLNERDPDDVNFYAQNYQRLWYEIGAQSLINNVLKTNQFDQTTTRKLVKDIFWAKAICTQAYVDQTTGEIKYKYRDPQICRGIFGESNDGKDDIARGWEDMITVMEWMELIGNDFDFTKHWKQLLWAINFCNNQKFTGFIRGGVSYDCCGDMAWMETMGCASVKEPALLQWSMAYKFKVFVGYMEYKTWEATSTKLTNTNDPDYMDYVPYQYQISKKKAKEGYEKTSKLQQQWYCNYFLATSSLSQYIYKFQKVYYQQISGANDEYSNGTLCYYQEEGKSAVDLAKVYLQLVNFCYYRMLWIIYKAKPDADEFIWEELTQLAQTVKREFPQAGTNAAAPKLDTVISDLIKQMRQKHVRIRTYPRIDGKAMPQISPIEKQGTGGIDPIAIAMQAIQSWAEGQIAAKIGVNPMRIGANPPSRESTESEQRTLDASFSTTGYFYRMLQYLKSHLATTTMNYATDILQYKDSLPYKWIKTVMGNESFQALNALGKVSAHRMGIYIQDYNYAFERDRLIQAADIALQQKTITLGQWGVVARNHENPNLGFKILAHLELKAKKRERAQALQDMKLQDQMSQNQHDRIMTQMKYDRETKWGTAKIDAQSFLGSAQINSEGRINTQELKNAGAVQNQVVKNDGKIVEETTKKNLEAQEPIV